MRRDLGDGYEVDDDKARIDRAAVHRYLGGESYWAKGRPRETQDRLIDEATRVVGLYKDGAQIGFCRAFSDGIAAAYLADVYVLDDHRGHGLGEALVREMVEGDPALANVKWLLHTENMHPLYRKVGFEDPNYKVMERRSTRKASESG
jgi:GNAT superfamily N-acetyltransferase